MSLDMLLDVPWRRLFKEEDGVEGSCWFAKTNDCYYHKSAGWLRVGVKVVLSPLNMSRAFALLCVPSEAHRVLHRIHREYFSPQWQIEFADTPSALLVARSSGHPEYAPTGRDPRFLVKLYVTNDVGIPGNRWEQIKFESGMKYTALSYAMSAAEELHGTALPTNFSPEDRRKVCEALLRTYATASHSGKQYVWLDELCLSENGDDERGPGSIANEELGAMADIFRHASQVCIFCNADNCDHTGMGCSWGNRLWTLPEIIHASKVLTMVRKGDRIEIVHPPSARSFKEHMQSNAAENGHWHLYAILQHATNSGAVSWQHAIHALVVEAIRRGERAGFTDHNHIGKALNGLLPRRAKLGDLKGDNGWSDLEWLLELNQGFYNAASLAAVCTLSNGGHSTAERPSPGWLGKPIPPRVGQERLEPLVNAFPVGCSFDASSSLLHLIGPEILGVRHTLKRDGNALYHNPQLKLLKWGGIGMVVAVWIFAPGVWTVWLSSALYSLMELLVGTKFVVREGWVFFRDDQLGLQHEDSLSPRMVLRSQDPNFANISEWGENQLAPTWGEPEEGSFRGTLIDLSTMCYTKCIANSIPNAIVPLAQHGNGITCMLVDRATSGNSPAPKAGLVSVPPHILASTRKSGSMMIGQKLQGDAGTSLWGSFVKFFTYVQNSFHRWCSLGALEGEMVEGGAEVGEASTNGHRQPGSRRGYQGAEE